MKATPDPTKQELQEVATLINTLLADEYVLHTKTRYAQWNLNDQANFHLQKFFEGQHETLSSIMDELAGHIRSMGQPVLVSMKDFLNIVTTSEENPDFNNSDRIIETLLRDHESIIRFIQKDIIINSDKIKKPVISVLVRRVMDKHEKIAWMLRSSKQMVSLVSAGVRLD